MDLYEKRAYMLAIPKLEAVLHSEKDENQKNFIKFYLGLCHMYTGDVEEAKHYLQPLVDSNFDLKDYILDLPIY